MNYPMWEFNGRVGPGEISRKFNPQRNCEGERNASRIQTKYPEIMRKSVIDRLQSIRNYEMFHGWNLWSNPNILKARSFRIAEQNELLLCDLIFFYDGTLSLFHVGSYLLGTQLCGWEFPTWYLGKHGRIATLGKHRQIRCCLSCFIWYM